MNIKLLVEMAVCLIVFSLLFRLVPAFGFINQVFSGVTRSIGSAFKGMVPARRPQESKTALLIRIGGLILGVGIVFLFVIPMAWVFKWAISLFFANTTSPVASEHFLILAVTMLVTFLVGALSAYNRSNESTTYLASAYNTGAAWFLLTQNPLVSSSAAVLALGTFGIFWASCGNSTQSRARTTDKQTEAKGVVNRAVTPRYNFSYIAGMADLKVEMLKAGNAITKAKSSKNGILFYGPPGNGKTFMAEALAGELRLPFLSVSFGDMASQWVGETTVNAMKIFDDAEAQAPCLLFMDEIDSVFIDRNKVYNSDSEAPKTLNAILTRLVDIRSKGVVVVGATNFLDRLDSASIREGRFDFKVEIPAPDYEARVSLIRNGLKNLIIDKATIESVSNRWEGFSVSRIRAIADKALEVASENGKRQLSFDDLMAALRKIQGSNGDKLPENVPSVDELFLSEEMRNRMNNIVARMSNIEEVERMGGNAPAGILFYGPPGTGKTLGAMALAKTSKWAFIKTSGNELLEKPEMIDKIVARASDIRPCIIFIDEGDDVLADRKMSPMSKSVTNRLLAIMDGAGGRAKDVVFVAATNHPDMLDPAMLRGGRFTEKIEFNLPSNSVVHEYVAKWISKCKAPLAADFNVESVSALLSGQSLANAKEILQGAINESIVRITTDRDEKVRMQDIKDAIDLIAKETY